MLVALRKRSLGSNLLVGWNAPNRTVRKVVVDKSKLVSCLQMLHANENSVLVSTKDAFVQLLNTGNDGFVLAFGRVDDGMRRVEECRASISPHGIHWLTPSQTAQDSMVQLLFYAQRQLLPTYSKAVRVAESMQSSFGNIAALSGGVPCGSGVDESFMLNNASTVSKLMDMLSAAKGFRRLSAAQAGRLTWLASMFCSSAPASKAFSLFNVTQMQMTTMSDYTTERLYEQAPEKQHITLLMRGDNAVNDRIRRFNVAVRVFPADSEFVRELLPQLVGLNASIFTPVMVVTGISNNQAAAIFLSSDSLRMHTHASAINTFMCGLAPPSI